MIEMDGVVTVDLCVDAKPLSAMASGCAYLFARKVQIGDLALTKSESGVASVSFEDKTFAKETQTMKRLFARIPFVLAALLLTLPVGKVPRQSGNPNTFTGEVTDTFCAQNGSHDEMMAKMASMGRDKETCTKKCKQIGAKYVLYDEAQKRVYKLDDQAKAEAFAGKKVRVSGTLEGDAIQVANLEALG